MVGGGGGGNGYCLNDITNWETSGENRLSVSIDGIKSNCCKIRSCNLGY